MLTAVEVEYRWEYKEAATHTRHTHSIDDFIKGNRGKTVSPAANYMELKLNIGTYCGLLWSILGDHCNYYKDMLKLFCILDHEECFTIRAAYMTEVCTRITWAIVDDGCTFFGQNPVALDFAPSATYHFLTSFLEAITDVVPNALIIQ